jgi:hypothetical protein
MRRRNFKLTDIQVTGDLFSIYSDMKKLIQLLDEQMYFYDQPGEWNC